MMSAGEIPSEKFFTFRLRETETPLEGFLKGPLKEKEPFGGLFLSFIAVLASNQMRYCRKRESRAGMFKWTDFRHSALSRPFLFMLKASLSSRQLGTLPVFFPRHLHFTPIPKGDVQTNGAFYLWSMCSVHVFPILNMRFQRLWLLFKGMGQCCQFPKHTFSGL